MHRLFFYGKILVIALVVAGCGSVAQPRYVADAIVDDAQATATAVISLALTQVSESAEVAAQPTSEPEATAEATMVVEAEIEVTEEATQETEMVEVTAEAPLEEAEVTEEAIVVEPETEATEEAVVVEPETEATEEVVAEAEMAPSDVDVAAGVEAGDAIVGEALFQTFQPEAGFACSTCHLVDTENRLIGPGLLNLASRSETRVEGLSAAEYIYESIVNPDAYIVEDFSDELMPENWHEIYTDAEIFDIVAYLFTLEAADATSETEADTTEASEETAVVLPDVDVLAGVESGSAIIGEALFATFQPEAGFACSTCHLVDNDSRLIGPGLLTLVERSETRVEGLAAHDYIYQAIVDPNAYIVEDYTADLMPKNWHEIYTDAEIFDIMAYLYTLAP